MNTMISSLFNLGNVFLITLPCVCLAQIDTNVTIQVQRHGTNDTSQGWYVVERVYRGTTKTLEVIRSRTDTGKLAALRGYYVGGELILSESDNDGTGVFNGITVYNTATGDVDMFVRKKDGSVRPAPASDVDFFKKGRSAGKGFGKALLEQKHFDPMVADRLLSHLRTELRELNREQSITPTNTP